MQEEYSRVQWFPGHMAKAKRKIQESLSKVDAAVELVDARIPFSSRNPLLGEMLSSRPRIILLNKCDLADPNATAKWIDYYKKNGVAAIAADCKTGKNLKALLPAVREALKDKIASWEQKGMVGRTIRIMAVGIPNVGKSAFINAMCRGGNAGKADVQDRPGVTRQTRWFTIGKGFDLLDTPGVLWHKFEDPKVGEMLAFTGAVNDDVIDTVYLAGRLLEYLKNDYADLISARYKLGADDVKASTGLELLEKIGRKRGMLISGGEIDTERAAGCVLDEFRSGKIGRITLEHI